MENLECLETRRRTSMTSNKKDARMPQVPVSEINLAGMGLGEVAYVRKVTAGDVERMTGHKLPTGPDKQLYCLYMADGTPMAVSDSREAAVANAFEHDLTAISVH
jgi:hypothetical protein